MNYRKLVRDRVPEIIVSGGQQAKTHTAGDEEYWLMLKDKLVEESSEFLHEETAEELADILEVLRAMCEFRGIEWDTLEAFRAKKIEERGGFAKRIILDEVLDRQ